MKNNNRLNDIERKVLRLKKKGLTRFGIAVKLGVPEPIVYEICSKRKEPCKWQLEKVPAVFLVFLFMFLLLGISFASATSVLLSDQGTDVKQSGAALSSGNLNVLIYSASSGGTPLFNQTFTGAIVNGSWNVMINPDLEFGKSYWKDYSINGVNLNFSGQDRLEFSSPLGYINNATFINFSLINSCPSGQAIRQVNVNGSVVCQSVSGNITDTDTQWNIAGSNYLINSSGVLNINETKLNNTIDARQTSTNLTNYALKNQSETFVGNITTTQTGFFGLLGSLASRITKLFVTNIDATGDVNVTGTITLNGTSIDDWSDVNIPGSSTNDTTWNITSSAYLYNNSGILDVNESKLNRSIDLRNTLNTTNSSYLYVDNKLIYLNETKLNATIDARVPSAGYQSSAAGWTNTSSTISTNLNVNITANVTANKFIGDGSGLTNLPSIVNYTHLSNFTDNLGNRGYTSLSNFTNDVGYVNATGLQTYNETTQINSLNASKLDINDQRYNDTVLISSVNTSANINSLGFLNKSGTNANQNINFSPYNITAAKFIGDGSLLTGITATGDGTGGWANTSTTTSTNLNVNITGNVTANKFIGDGSLLTGISGTADGTGGWINDSTQTNTSLNVNLLNGKNITTTGTGLFGLLGSAASRITKLFVQDIDASGNLNVTGNVTASKFIGDGSMLTNLPSASGDGSGGWTNTSTSTSTSLNVNVSGNVTASKFIGDGSLLTGISSGVSYTHLSNFTDDLGNRGHTSLSNFTNNVGFINSTQAQIFNDTAAIASKLDATDQRYNETAYINTNFYTKSQVYNRTEIDAFGFVNSSGLQSYNETSLITSVNQTLSANKLDVADQRYNDTAKINAVNTTANIDALGFLNKSGTNANQNINVSPYNVTASHFIGDGSLLNGITGSGSADGTGGWTNTSTTTSTPLNINVTSSNLTIVNGRIGIGTNAPNQALHVVGNTNVTGNVTASKFIGDGSLLTGVSASGGGWADDGTIVRLTASGDNVAIGSSTIKNTAGVVPKVSSYAGYNMHSIYAFAGDTSTAHLVIGKSKDGTVGNMAYNPSGETLGIVSFAGADGSQFSSGANIKAITTEAWSSTIHGTKLVFQTTANGATTNSDRMTIEQNGNIAIGATTNQSERLYVDGNVKSTANITASKFIGDGSLLTNLPVGSGDGTGSWTNTSTTTSTSLNVNITTGNLTIMNGKVGIGTASPSLALQVVGQIDATNNISTPGLCLNGDCRNAWPIAGSDTVWNIVGSNYLVNISGVLNVNETKLNATIDARAVAGSSPGGSNGQIQFNNNGNFGADSDLTWDNTNKRLGIGTANPTEGFQTKGKTQTARFDSGYGSSSVSNVVYWGLQDDANNGGATKGFVWRIDKPASAGSSADLTLRLVQGFSNSCSGYPFCNLSSINGVGTDAVTFAGNGNVGIGTTNPGGKLEINTGGGTGTSLKIEHSGSNFIVRPVSSGGSSTVIENTGGGSIVINPSGGNVGIGTASPAGKLDVIGTIKGEGQDLIIMRSFGWASGDFGNDLDTGISATTYPAVNLVSWDAANADDWTRFDVGADGDWHLMSYGGRAQITFYHKSIATRDLSG